MCIREPQSTELDINLRQDPRINYFKTMAPEHSEEEAVNSAGAH